MRGETRLMRHVDLPFGVSILAVARRPLASERAAEINVMTGTTGRAPEPVAVPRPAVASLADLQARLSTAPAEVGDEAAVV
jgi:hypothetical protein